MNLTKATVKLIKKDTGLVLKICEATNKSYPTVMRWLKTNSKQLTTADCLQVICTELKMEQSEVLSNQKVA